MIDIPDLDALAARVGQEIAVSEWVAISQSQVNQFASLTDDHQWIHVDPERARQESPFGSTVVHGFLTLAMVPTLMRRALRLPSVRMALNYGTNRVRFVSPVPAGARIRGRFTPVSIAKRGGGTDVTWSVTVEREQADKPCCVAEFIVRYVL